jgi:dTDP-glucose pyrophosphorylase
VSPSIQSYLVSPGDSVRAAFECINRNRGIALVADDAGRLQGILTDGDVRRAVLNGVDLAGPVGHLIKGRPAPVTAPAGCSPEEQLAAMRAHHVRVLPVVDPEGRVVDLALMEEVLAKRSLPLSAVVMAGGFGKRLRPMTDHLPKPMLPIGDKPILERIMEGLQDSGIHRVQITTHYKGEAIREHFGDGERFGLDIGYMDEKAPLGTAGVLAEVADTEEPLLVMNGDILTRVDFEAMHDFHREHGAELTVGVREYEFEVPYGVMRCDGERVLSVEEKPRLQFFVNAGIYLMQASARRSIPSGQRFDMTDLIARLTAEGRRVAAFPIVEYWIDIGHEEAYQQAQDDVKTWPTE